MYNIQSLFNRYIHKFWAQIRLQLNGRCANHAQYAFQDCCAISGQTSHSRNNFHVHFVQFRYSNGHYCRALQNFLRVQHLIDMDNKDKPSTLHWEWKNRYRAFKCMTDWDKVCLCSLHGDEQIGWKIWNVLTKEGRVLSQQHWLALPHHCSKTQKILRAPSSSKPAECPPFLTVNTVDCTSKLIQSSFQAQQNHTRPGPIFPPYIKRVTWPL